MRAFVVFVSFSSLFSLLPSLFVLYILLSVLFRSSMAGLMFRVIQDGRERIRLSWSLMEERIRYHFYVQYIGLITY